MIYLEIRHGRLAKHAIARAAAVRYLSAALFFFVALLLSATPLVAQHADQPFGEVYAWGRGADGALGNGKIDLQQQPVAVVTTHTSMQNKSIIAVAAGYDHSIALSVDSFVFQWGLVVPSAKNVSSGTAIKLVSTPITVNTTGTPMEGKHITAVDTGYRYSLALDSMGYVYSWGSPRQLGDGGKSLKYQFQPVAVLTTAPSAIRNKHIIAISAGYQHAMVLDSAGSVYTWGESTNGQLGIGRSNVTYFGPVAVVTANTSMQGKVIVNITAGGYHSVALDSTGKVYSWGAGSYGQLGAGYQADQTRPVAVDITGTPMENKIIIEVAAGGYHTMTLGSDGKVYTWGHGGYGQLGNGKQDHQSKPVLVEVAGDSFKPMNGKIIVHIAAGYFYSVALDSDGHMYAWGQGTAGQLGDSGTKSALVPHAVQAIIGPMVGDFITAISAGYQHTLALSNGPICQPGTFKNLSALCQPCGRGNLSITFSARECGTCAGNDYSDKEDASECKSCGPVMIAVGDHTNCVFDSRLTVAIVVPSAIVVLCIISIVSVIIISSACIVRKNRLQKLRDDMLRKSLLEDALGETDTELELQPHFFIDTDMFKINFQELHQLKEIGTGGSGAVVFRCKWNTELCAVKLFRTSNFGTEHDFKEFEKELQLLGSLRHPNIVLFFGACLHLPRVGIVLEFCVHGTLAEYMQKQCGRLSLECKLQILMDISRGVNFLHTRGIIHRDIKMANCLVDKNHVVKLADFGLSKRKQDMLTTMTSIVGTSAYMAPEVTLGLPYGEKIDVFSFGIIMAELLLEKLNPYNTDAMNIQMRVAQDPTFRPIIPDDLRTSQHSSYIVLMEQCWSHDPGMRPSFSMVVAGLEQALFEIQRPI